MRGAGSEDFERGDPFGRYGRRDPSERQSLRRAAAYGRAPGAQALRADSPPWQRPFAERGRLRRGLALPVAKPVAEQAAAEEPARETAVDWIEIALVDRRGEPVGGEAYRVLLPDGAVREGRLDADGRARLTDIEPGACEVTFPNLDAAEWRRA
jgi:hypothetical protein